MIGKNPSKFKGENLPVTNVSWYDAVAFCQKLGESTYIKGNIPFGYRYKLPTETQWEYACRAGTTTAFHFGATLQKGQANFNKHVNKTQPVGSYPANQWGLHDMHGNVWEWCSDKYDAEHYRELTGGHFNHDDPSTLPLVTDPKGPDDSPNHKYGDWRVMRGGAWITGPLTSRCASKTFGEANDAFCYTGFRIVRGSR